MSADWSRVLHLASPVVPDRDLLRAHAAGDPAAFDELARRHGPLARRAAAEVCPAAADDVAQATLAALARKAAAVGDRESAAGWVFETARRLALKARTAAARRTARECLAAVPAPPPDPLDAITLREVRAAVAEELARLPDDLRLPLVLCYWDGAARAAAAARLGCSVSTLKRRLDAGRDRLAARLARRGFTGPAVLAALVATGGAGAAVPPPPRVSELPKEVAVRTVLRKWAVGVAAGLVVAAGVAASGGREQSGPIPAPRPVAKRAAAHPDAAAAKETVKRFYTNLEEGKAKENEVLFATPDAAVSGTVGWHGSPKAWRKTPAEYLTGHGDKLKYLALDGVEVDLAHPGLAVARVKYRTRGQSGHAVLVLTSDGTRWRVASLFEETYFVW